MNDTSMWNELLSAMLKTHDKAEIDKWLKPLSIDSLRGDLITLAAPNKFYKNWVEDKYLLEIKKVLKASFSIDADIKIVLKGEQSAPKQFITPIPQVFENVQDIFGMPLNPQFTFDTFVAGDSNSFAHAACVAVSKGVSNLYNPLYIYGDVGLGKTHLMHAVGNELRTRFPKLRILYTTGESFINEYVRVMRNMGLVDEFKNKYRNIDVLLFDDVQAIAGHNRQKTMEEFFFTYSLLEATQKRIILTSNMPPHEIPELDKRLSSRFSSGLMVDVQSPSVEEREAIIFKKLQMNNADIKPEVVRFLAENVRSSSVRDLLGLLVRLSTLADIKQVPITIEFTQNILKDFLLARDRVLSPEEIVTIVATYFHIKPVDLKSKSRANSIVYPRSIAMYMLRLKSALSLKEIGSIFGRDHSTVMTAVKKITDKIDKDEELKGTIETLSTQMKMANG